MVKISGCIIILVLLATAVAADDSLCFEEAGVQYGINPDILRAIANVESKYNPRAINRNRNGSYDFGVMQINSLWGHTYGPEWWSTLGDPCTNIKAGAMILSSCMKKYGYSWEAIGCYNSQTPRKRNSYAVKVFNQLQRFEHIDRLIASKSIKSTNGEGNDNKAQAVQKGEPTEQNTLMQSQFPTEPMQETTDEN